MSKAMKLALKDMGISANKYLTLKLEVEDLVELDGLFVTADKNEEVEI